MTNVKGMEWQIGEILLELAKKLEAKEIVSVEGVGSPVPTDKADAYFFSNFEEGKKKFASFKLQPLKEGIILGVTATLLLLAEDHKFSSIFVETHSSLPDSKAAAKAVEMLDKYLNLKIAYEPLIKQAAIFEAKVKKLMEQGEIATAEQQKKTLSYVG
jgi:predicted ATP-grasp superfamily ATP-dependent carboligase